MGGLEEMDCEGEGEFPNWLAGLRSEEIHCPSWCVRTATKCCRLSVHLLKEMQKIQRQNTDAFICMDAPIVLTNIPSVALFKQERAALSLAHSSELDPSLRIASLT